MIDLSDVAVVMTAKNRPGYLARSLESWTKARHAYCMSAFVLALGRSPVENEMAGLAVREHRLPVTVRMDSEQAAASPGVHRALGEAIDFALSEPGVNFVVCTEEDVEVSDDVLEYMAWARHLMDRNSELLVACAHNKGGCGWDNLHAGPQDADVDQQVARPRAYYNPWCWGISRDSWFKIIRPQWDWECNTGGAADSGYDWNMAIRIMPRGGYLAVVPDAARSQNIGKYGGVYSTPEIYELQLALSYRPHRPPGIYWLEGESS